MSSTVQRSEQLILAIETATRAGSVAVARGEHILSSRAGDASISHSSNLIEMIDEVLTEARAKLSDVDFFAAATGPGSFTGLRIGLATIKAFAAMTRQPAVGVSTLATIACAARIEGQIVSLLPAGRGEVFAQMFAASNREVVALDAAAHLSPAETLKRYDNESNVTWAGEGVEKLAEYLRSTKNESGAQSVQETAAANGSVPLARFVAALALKDYREGKSVTADELQAVYVRASDAEINERWQQQNAQQSTLR